MKIKISTHFLKTKGRKFSMKQWNNWISTAPGAHAILVNHLNDPPLPVEHETEYKHGAFIKGKKQKSIKDSLHPLKGYLALL